METVPERRPASNEKLRALRKQKQWTAAYASERVGVDPRTYMRWELNGQRPALRLQKLLCELFEKTPEELGF